MQCTEGTDMGKLVISNHMITGKGGDGNTEDASNCF
jgi:hypothetical protein